MISDFIGSYRRLETCQRKRKGSYATLPADFFLRKFCMRVRVPAAIKTKQAVSWMTRMLSHMYTVLCGATKRSCSVIVR